MDMRNNIAPTEASRKYAAHYTGRDLPLAFQLYKELMTSHPSTQEAGYARMQVQNLINTVVPKQELMDAQIERLLVHFENDDRRDAG